MSHACNCPVQFGAPYHENSCPAHPLNWRGVSSASSDTAAQEQQHNPYKEIAELRAALAKKEEERQYHMNAINLLEKELGLSGETSDSVISAAIVKLRELEAENATLRARLATWESNIKDA